MNTTGIENPKLPYLEKSQLLLIGQLIIYSFCLILNSQITRWFTNQLEQNFLHSFQLCNVLITKEQGFHPRLITHETNKDGQLNGKKREIQFKACYDAKRGRSFDWCIPVSFPQMSCVQSISLAFYIAANTCYRCGPPAYWQSHTSWICLHTSQRDRFILIFIDQGHVIMEATALTCALIHPSF